ncbi:hypothetical protein [Herbidospora sp. NBRC 101105]|nr:hypothetical protein [Herbidospora sp. NBRC 101105]GLX98303.1 hypothetical protein Hesp01_62530 [Herbidospora sp. NBRC 101105]
MPGELIAGYANYASTESVLSENTTAEWWPITSYTVSLSTTTTSIWI